MNRPLTVRDGETLSVLHASRARVRIRWKRKTPNHPSQCHMARLFNQPVRGRFVGPRALAVHPQKNFAVVKVCYGRLVAECTGVEMGFQRMEQEVPASAARDRLGRWRHGVSGNPAGRPKGSRNRWRRADPARARAWTAGEWNLHFARVELTAPGNPNQRKAAAYAGCQALWRLLNPPKAEPGMCAHCGRSLDPPNAIYDWAPVSFEGAFVHYGCIRQFAHSRWQQAKEALSRFGIRA